LKRATARPRQRRSEPRGVLPSADGSREAITRLAPKRLSPAFLARNTGDITPQYRSAKFPSWLIRELVMIHNGQIEPKPRVERAIQDRLGRELRLMYAGLGGPAASAGRNDGLGEARLLRRSEPAGRR
jgi:hypothetical protein